MKTLVLCLVLINADKLGASVGFWLLALGLWAVVDRPAKSVLAKND